MYSVDGFERQATALLAGGAHRGDDDRGVTLHDSIGVPDGIHDAFTGTEFSQLRDRPRECHFNLQPGILIKTLQDDGSHLVAKPGEAPKPVEDAFAPQESVRIPRQLVAEGTQLEPGIRTVIIEIAGYDTILQHASKQDAVSSRRKAEAPRDGPICG